MNNFIPILTLPLADFIERPRQKSGQEGEKETRSPKEADMSNQEMELMAHLCAERDLARPGMSLRNTSPRL